MSRVLKKTPALNAFAASTAAGAAVWSGTAAMLPVQGHTALPVLAAVACAGAVSSMIMTRAAKHAAKHANQSMSQRIYALNSHAIVNVVDENSIITEVNQQLLQLTGFREEDLVGQHISVLYPRDEKDVPAAIRKSLAARETWQGDTPLLHADGSELRTLATVMPLTDPCGKWTGSITVRTDKTHSDEVLAGHHTAKTLYELRDAIWIIDSETENFDYLNRAAKSQLAQLMDGARVDSLLELDNDEGLEKIRAAFQHLRNSSDTGQYFETTCFGVPSHVSIKYISDAEVAPRFLVLISDISARVEQEKRMAEFVATVSHELRSPLTSIKGAMGLLLSKSAGDIPDKAAAMLEIAHRNADRLILIINDILDLEKMGNGEMDFQIEDVDLGDLIRETNSANATLQQRFGVDLVVTGADTPLPFRTDPNRFIQILTNLLSNAHKFSAPGSRITIDVRCTDGEARIAVTDQGPGIPREEQSKIFQRFADLENSNRAAKGGTGLGLNICKALVDALGGTIGFDTREGVGTTFYFTLPVTAGQPATDTHECDQTLAS